MLTTFFLSIVWDLEIGIVVSIIISLVLVVRRSARTRMTILVRPRAPSPSSVCAQRLLTCAPATGTHPWDGALGIDQRESGGGGGRAGRAHRAHPREPRLWCVIAPLPVPPVPARLTPCFLAPAANTAQLKGPCSPCRSKR